MSKYPYPSLFIVFILLIRLPVFLLSTLRRRTLTAPPRQRQLPSRRLHPSRERLEDTILPVNTLLRRACSWGV
jgi:hypothetical protein